MPADRIPPQNIEAEQSLLGALLIDKDAILKIADIVRIEDFYRQAHSDIYDTMIELHAKREPIDMTTLPNRLSEKGLLERIGGRAYLTELSAIVATAAHVVNYATIIQTKATRRRLLSAAGEIVTLAHEETEDLSALLDEAEQKLFGVSKSQLQTNFTSIKDTLDGTFERIDELHKQSGKLRGIPTGYRDIDSLLAGLQRSDLVILAARPSVGKTSFALDIARNAAIRTKLPVGIFSLEMSKEQLVDRMLCAEAGVDLWKMRTGKLNDNGDDSDFSRIGHALGSLSEAPIFIDDTANVNVMEIRTKARRLQTEHGLGMLVIDYLQLMESRRTRSSDNRTQEVAEITRALKGIARELDIPVVALSQLSRLTEQSKPAIPKLSHLRESGSIEQDADVVMFLYRKAADKNYKLEEIPLDERYLAEVHVAKHRNGPCGVVKMFFDEARVSFKDLEKRHQAPPPAQPAEHTQPVGAATPVQAHENQPNPQF
jgi:replicative DNA helicase